MAVVCFVDEHLHVVALDIASHEHSEVLLAHGPSFLAHGLGCLKIAEKSNFSLIPRCCGHSLNSVYGYQHPGATK